MIWGRGQWWGKVREPRLKRDPFLLSPQPLRVFHISFTISHYYLGAWNRLVICLIALKVEFSQARVFRGVVSPPAPEKIRFPSAWESKKVAIHTIAPLLATEFLKNNRFVLVTRGTSYRMFPELVSI